MKNGLGGNIKRDAFIYLEQWKGASNLKPLLLRGARQVGKSYLVRQLGQLFDEFIELNFEESPKLKEFFETPGDVEAITTKIAAFSGKKIVSGKTLLFLDEVQLAPNAIISLRYFYEKMPHLHIIAAGSLIEFALEQIGIPVGRVRSLYIYPMHFGEFLTSLGDENLLEMLVQHDCTSPLDQLFMDKLQLRFSEYLSVGGMPEAVKIWRDQRDLEEVAQVHNDLIETYKQDFAKYAKKNMVKNIALLFQKLPSILGEKFIYSKISKELRSRELRPALDLLAKAGLVHIICHSSANGVPVAAEENNSLFKVIFLDVALVQKMLGVDKVNWITDFSNKYINKGNIIESFVGQELIAYQAPWKKTTLHYWVREKRGATAEIDYLLQLQEQIVAIEVKAGKRRNSKSLAIFKEEKPHVKRIIYTSMDNFGQRDFYQNVPLFALKNIFKVT